MDALDLRHLAVRARRRLLRMHFESRIGHLGLKFPGSAEDTLGYTVLARKDRGHD